MSKKKRNINWCIPVPKELDNQVKNALKSTSHATKSELIRDAVRRIVEPKEITTQKRGCQK